MKLKLQQQAAEFMHAIKRSLLLVQFLLLCLVNPGLAQTTLYSENFESGFPAGWSEQGGWSLGDAETLSSDKVAFTALTNTTNFIAFNDDALGAQHVGGGWLRTTSIDLTDLTGDIWVKVNYMFYDSDINGDEKARIFISNDDVDSWQLLKSLSGTIDWEDVTLNISSFAGEKIKLAFDYDDGGGQNRVFGIDDIRILNSPSTVSIDSQERENSIDPDLITIYSNPVLRRAIISLELDVPQKVRITLFDALGQKVSAVNYGKLFGAQELKYDMSDLTQGLYYLNIQLDENQITKKIIKS